MKILITNSQRDLRRFSTSSRDDNVFQWVATSSIKLDIS